MKNALIVLLAAALYCSCSSSRQTSHPHNSGRLQLTVDGEHDGSSAEKAIIITAPSEQEGVSTEYAWLKKTYPGYSFQRQSLQSIGSRHYDLLEIKTSEGDTKKIWFDITDFFGKGLGF